MKKEQTNSWESDLKEIIDGDWELMELNPGRPYRTGMKEVHFIKLKVLISKEKEKVRNIIHPAQGMTPEEIIRELDKEYC